MLILKVRTKRNTVLLTPPGFLLCQWLQSGLDRWFFNIRCSFLRYYFMLGIFFVYGTQKRGSGKFLYWRGK